MVPLMEPVENQVPFRARFAEEYTFILDDNSSVLIIKTDFFDCFVISMHVVRTDRDPVLLCWNWIHDCLRIMVVIVIAGIVSLI